MRCTTWHRVVGEDPIGTAAVAQAWVAVEQPGPWGAKAPTQSGLPPDLGAELDLRLAAAGTRLALLRHPAGSTDRFAHPRQVLVACARPGSTFLLVGTVDDPADLLALDLPALVSGDEDAVRRSMPGLLPQADPSMLVCVNGKRDACCALLGRPVAHALHDQFGERVWEANHLGGHRFAPTSVVLPHGYSYAGTSPERGEAIMTAAGRGFLLDEGVRGRSCWQAPEQAADLAVRRECGTWGLDDVRVIACESRGIDLWAVTVEVLDQVRTVEVARTTDGTARPESCGKEPAALYRWRTTVRA